MDMDQAPVSIEISMEEPGISKRTLVIASILALFLIAALTIAVFKNTLRSANDYGSPSTPISQPPQMSPTIDPSSDVTEDEVNKIEIDTLDTELNSLSPDIDQL